MRLRKYANFILYSIIFYQNKTILASIKAVVILNKLSNQEVQLILFPN